MGRGNRWMTGLPLQTTNRPAVNIIHSPGSAAMRMARWFPLLADTFPICLVVFFVGLIQTRSAGHIRGGMEQLSAPCLAGYQWRPLFESVTQTGGVPPMDKTQKNQPLDVETWVTIHPAALPKAGRDPQSPDRRSHSPPFGRVSFGDGSWMVRIDGLQEGSFSARLLDSNAQSRVGPFSRTAARPPRDRSGRRRLQASVVMETNPDRADLKLQ